MRSVTISRNYAETLFELGDGSGQLAEYGELIEAVAVAIQTTPQIEDVLMSPRVPKATNDRAHRIAVK